MKYLAPEIRSAVEAALVMAVGMGFGRFAYTALYPHMVQEGVLGLNEGSLAFGQLCRISHWSAGSHQVQASKLLPLLSLSNSCHRCMSGDYGTSRNSLGDCRSAWYCRCLQCSFYGRRFTLVA